MSGAMNRQTAEELLELIRNEIANANYDDALRALGELLELIGAPQHLVDECIMCQGKYSQVKRLWRQLLVNHVSFLEEQAKIVNQTLQMCQEAETLISTSERFRAIRRLTSRELLWQRLASFPVPERYAEKEDLIRDAIWKVINGEHSADEVINTLSGIMTPNEIIQLVTQAYAFLHKVDP